MDVNVLIQQLPPYKGEKRLIERRQDTWDIIREIMRKHKETAAHYDMLDPKLFWKGNAWNTARYLFDLCKQKIGYVIEPTLEQTVKTPAAILVEAEGDCKHYASFIVGVCCALQRRGYPIQAKYRFACYEKGKRNPGHVFAVVMDQGREIWVDPVLGSFDQRTPQYVFKQDKIPPMEQSKNSISGLYDISGVGEGGHEYTRPAQQQGGHWLDQWGSGSTVGRHHHHGLFDKFLDSPLNPMHPGIPGGWLRHHHHHHHMGDAEMGKHKGHKKHHGLHIKIKPGNVLKVFKKIGMAVPRNAFLALTKLNVFNMAVQFHKAIKGHPEKWKKLHDLWVKLGGSPNKLNTAINAGVKTHNKLHKHSQVSGTQGLSDMYAMPFYQPAINGGDDMGFAVVAIPAMLAAAAPIIKVLKDALHGLGVNTDHATAAADSADSDAIDAHNKATDDKGDGNPDINADGSVDHGEGVTTHVTTDPKTGKQAISYDVKDPTEGLNSDGDQVTTKTKTKTTEEEGPDGEEEEETKTKTKTVVKHGGSGGGGLMAFVDKAKDWIVEHKKPLIIGTGVLVTAIVLKKVLDNRKPKRHR